jgi:hypothetical protein
MSKDETRLSNIEEREKINFVRVLVQNWYIVLFVGSVVVGWTTLSISSNANAQSILDITTRLKQHETDGASLNSQIQIQLSQIQTDLAWIKLKLK